MGNIFSISLSCDTVVTSCRDCVAGQAEFVCKLEENLDALKTELAQLKDKRSDVIRKVTIAEDQQQLERLHEVQGWLSRAETLIGGADSLIEQSPQEIKKLCIGGCCSISPKSNLKFGKQIAKMLKDVVDHKSKGVFDKVAEEVPTPLAIERPSDHTVGLESTFNEAWSFLEAEQVGIVGLYGMGGVGKTTLLDQINNKFCESPNKFDVVIWIVVSKGFYIGKVQDDIAVRLRITDGDRTWRDKTTEAKARDIYMVLKKKKFVILLDDIWERVDLIKVGIPRPNQENGSKLVFTTRSTKVCGQMEAHKKIEVQCLPEEKAWELFHEKVGEETLDSNPCIRELAHEVAKECGGLPLAVVTIARAMACKNTVEEWKYAIEVLRRSSTSVFPDMGEEVYPLLKFSYDSLPNDMIRTCLLYCSLYSEDYKIEKDKVIDFWIGEGFLDGHGNTSLARNQGHDIIGSLLHACLLEEINEFGIKMHDVIRDMCLWIACKCEKEKWRFFVLANYQLTQLPEVQNWGSIHRMSLMGNRIENLVETPNCPDLRTLFLNNNRLKVINNDFFQFMCGLKVLDLSENGDIEELPKGISKLVSLECLDLSLTGIRQLPIELKALEKLKCLNLEFCVEIRIPRQLISAFLKLQVLRMLRCDYSSVQEVEDNSDQEDNSEWLVEELECLNHLNVLTVTITSALGLDRFLSSERLCSCTVSIDLRLFKDPKQLNILPLANMKRLNSLELEECESLEEVKMEWGGEGRMIKAQSHIQTAVIASEYCFQSLRSVFISGCSKLTDITWLILAPNLRDLGVSLCNNMEEIINERKLSQVAELVETSSLFAKLESLYLRYLPELKSIYWDTLRFSCLKGIYVSKCPKLKRLPLNSHIAKENKIKIRGEEEWRKELQWEDELLPPCDFVLNFFKSYNFTWGIVRAFGLDASCDTCTVVRLELASSILCRQGEPNMFNSFCFCHHILIDKAVRLLLLALISGSLGAPNIKIPKLSFGKARVDNLKLNNVRIWIRQRPLQCTALVRRSEKVFSFLCGQTLESQAVKKQYMEIRENEVEYLVRDICNTTSISEFELKLGGFGLYIVRDLAGKSEPPPVIPSPLPVSVSTNKTVEAPDSNGAVSTPSLAITKPLSSSGTKMINSAADNETIDLEAISNVSHWLPYVSGEVIKILREDGDPVGYGDALIALLPSFLGIKKLQ
ncbi:hypothetical protein CRYUN_Cryun32bG0099700 [Craigia yunnanensis]